MTKVINDGKMKVELRERKELGGDEYFVQAYSGYPEFVLACSSGRRIFLFELKSFRVPRDRRIIEQHNGDVNHIIKWNSRSFISCSDDNKCVGFKIEQKSGNEDFYRMNKAPVYRLLKLDEKRFLTLNALGELKVILFFKKRIDKDFPLDNIDLGTMKKKCDLVECKTKENSFFVNASGDVFLINWKTNQRIGLGLKNVSKLISYRKFIKEEMLLCLIEEEEERKFVLYCCNSGVMKVFQGYNFPGRVNSVSIVRNKFLCVGDSVGLVRFLDIEDDNDIDEMRQVMPTEVAPDLLGGISSVMVLSSTSISTTVVYTGRFRRLTSRHFNISCLAVLNFVNLWDSCTPTNMAIAFDIDGNGEEEIITARVKVDLESLKGKGEMIFSKGPLMNDKGEFSPPKTIFTFEGPETVFDIVTHVPYHDNPEKTVVSIIAPQFFSQKLALYSSEDWKSQRYNTTIVDTGEAFDARLVDMNNNGNLDIIASMQVLGGDGNLYGYEREIGDKWKKHFLAGPFHAVGMSNGSPGMIDVIKFPDTPKPSFIIGGDDGGSFYLLNPTDVDWKYDLIRLYETNGTVAQPYVYYNDDKPYLLLNDYDQDKLLFFECKK